MKETEFKALISLLEDDDPSIGKHIEGKLLSMGEGVIPRLEAAWEEEADTDIQQRLEDIIYLIQSKGTIEELQAWMEEDDPSLLKAWFLISQYQYPELDYEEFRHHISRLSNRIWLRIRTQMNIPEKLVLVKNMLFKDESYVPNRKRVYDIQNYLINGFFETKKGGPISLGILYLILCEELEIPINGIILPGYFVLRYKDEKNEFFVDVFNKGAFFKREDLKRFLKEVNAEDSSKYYEPSTKKDIILNLIKTLAEISKRKKKTEQAEAWNSLLRNLQMD